MQPEGLKCLGWRKTEDITALRSSCEIHTAAFFGEPLPGANKMPFTAQPRASCQNDQQHLAFEQSIFNTLPLTSSPAPILASHLGLPHTAAAQQPPCCSLEHARHTLPQSLCTGRSHRLTAIPPDRHVTHSLTSLPSRLPRHHLLRPPLFNTNLAFPSPAPCLHPPTPCLKK